MFSNPIDTLEQRASFMDLLDRHFHGVTDLDPADDPAPPLMPTPPTEAELRAPVARMRPRREVVMVRDARVRRRRLRH